MTLVNPTKIACFSLLSLTLVAQKPADASGTHGGKNIVQIAVEAGQFTTLVTAVKAAGLADTLSGKGPFTVFAPTDAAFAKLGKDAIANLLKPENKDQLTAILTYHVLGSSMPASKVIEQKELTTLQGGKLAVQSGKDGVKIGSATVAKADVMASNGVIHVIDTVLLPPAKGASNLVEVAKQAGSFGTLLQAAVAAGLADTLSNDGPFTVFAPTDEAFAKLGKETIANLLKPENKQQLANVLKLHVVSGTVKAEQAMKLHSAKTLLGQELELKVDGGVLHVGSAKVLKADVTASNGVIHVIDTVLLPRE